MLPKACSSQPSYMVRAAEELLPALHSMQQEPAWSSLALVQQCEGWSDAGILSEWHKDLSFLAAQKILGDKAVQTIRSFYSFMMVCPPPHICRQQCIKVAV